ncbi:MAG: hypothetical protein Ta2A_06400 [Treponemataceae bacterium]|nr:MAG: hypothetical protein Ta2A_06400 [Treponemataceae bacterium]
MDAHGLTRIQAKAPRRKRTRNSTQKELTAKRREITRNYTKGLHAKRSDSVQQGTTRMRSHNPTYYQPAQQGCCATTSPEFSLAKTRRDTDVAVRLPKIAKYAIIALIMTINKLLLRNVKNRSVFTLRRGIECLVFYLIAVALFILQIHFWSQASLIGSMTNAKVLATAFDRNILLFVSADDFDTISVGLKAKFFNKTSVLQKLSKNYVTVNIDFSQSRFAATESAQNVSKSLQRKNERLREQMRRDFMLCTQYSLQQVPATPAIYLLTKKGYMIAVCNDGLDDASLTADGLFEKINFQQEKADKINALYKNIEDAKGIEKAKAIIAFNEEFDPNYQQLLVDLWAEFIELDPTNETGSLGKFVYLKAYTDATDFFVKEDYEGAYNQLMSVAENEYLSQDEKQQLVFNAVSIAFRSGILTAETVVGELQKAVDYAPESELGVYITGIIAQFAEAAQAAPDTPDATDDDYYGE